MGKRRAVVVVLVIGCHCFVYFLFIHRVSRHEASPDFLVADMTDLNVSSTRNFHPNGRTNASIPIPTAGPTVYVKTGNSSSSPFAVNPHPYKFTINQPNLCNGLKSRTVSAIILVCSAIPNFEERQVIRETWGSDASPSKNSSARLAFLLGSTSDGELQSKVQSEAEEHGDVIQEDFLDTYLNLTLKSVMLLRWVTDYCQDAQYVLKTDDDMYINIPNFLKASSKLKYRKNVIYGVVFRGVKPDRNPAHKWHIPLSQYPAKVVPDYVSGSAYAMTGDVAPKLYNTSLHVPFIQMEDIYITGVCASKAGVKRIDHPGFSYQKRASTGCAFKNAVTGHHVSKQEKVKIWKELNSKKLDCLSPTKKARS